MDAIFFFWGGGGGEGGNKTSSLKLDKNQWNSLYECLITKYIY